MDIVGTAKKKANLVKKEIISLILIERVEAKKKNYLIKV